MDENKNIIKAIAFVALAIIMVILIFNMFETNKAGNYQVKQVAWFGDLKVKNTPGTYGQWFGTISTYEIAGDIMLSKDFNDGGDAKGVAAERVLFPNGYADINFVGMYEIPLDEEVQKAIHIRYGSNVNLAYMIKQQVIEALKNTATLMSAEEAYSYKRADFVRLAWEQSLVGLYAANVETEYITNAAGQKQELKHYSVKLGEDGKPIITKPSILAEYGIKLPQFNIKDMDFDEKLIGLIESRKDAQKAQQDAITEKARGETRIAKEKAEQEVDKIKQVTIAQKEKEVAELNAEREYKVAMFTAKQAEEEKRAQISKGQGESEAARLKVAAGLTPQERVEWEYKTRVGVAAELAKVKVPSIVINGDSKGGANPMDAIGVNMLLDIMNKMEKMK